MSIPGGRLLLELKYREAVSIKGTEGLKNNPSVPFIMRRIAPAKLKELRQTLKDWTSKSRHKRLYQIAKQLRVKVLGHNRYFALKVSGQNLWHYYSMALLFKWFNRCNQWRRFNWAVYKQLLDVMGLPKLELMDDRRFGITFLFNKGAALHGGIVITEEPVAVVPHAGIYVGRPGNWAFYHDSVTSKR